MKDTRHERSWYVHERRRELMSGMAPRVWDSGNEEAEQRQCIDGSYTHQVVEKRSGEKMEGRGDHGKG